MPGLRIFANPKTYRRSPDAVQRGPALLLVLRSADSAAQSGYRLDATVLISKTPIEAGAP